MPYSLPRLSAHGLFLIDNMAKKEEEEHKKKTNELEQ